LSDFVDWVTETEPAQLPVVLLGLRLSGVGHTLDAFMGRPTAQEQVPVDLNQIIPITGNAIIEYTGPDCIIDDHPPLTLS
jgi:hypothetical protein